MVEPAKSVFAVKASIRRAVEAEGIPYTYISSNFFAGRFLPTLGQIGVTGLPIDKVLILGDGNVKGKTNYNLLTIYVLSYFFVGRTIKAICTCIVYKLQRKQLRKILIHFN